MEGYSKMAIFWNIHKCNYRYQLLDINYRYRILNIQFYAVFLGTHKMYIQKKVLWISINREQIVKRYPYSLRYSLTAHQSFILF